MRQHLTQQRNHTRLRLHDNPYTNHPSAPTPQPTQPSQQPQTTHLTTPHLQAQRQPTPPTHTPTHPTQPTTHPRCPHPTPPHPRPHPRQRQHPPEPLNPLTHAQPTSPKIPAPALDVPKQRLNRHPTPIPRHSRLRVVRHQQPRLASVFCPVAQHPVSVPPCLLEHCPIDALRWCALLRRPVAHRGLHTVGSAQANRAWHTRHEVPAHLGDVRQQLRAAAQPPDPAAPPPRGLQEERARGGATGS
jgi:hypothetical protein